MDKIIVYLLLLSLVKCQDSTIDIYYPIFTSETWILDVISIVSVFLISILTTMTGVGGGSLLVPIFMLINHFDIKAAIPLSVVTILGSTIIRIFYFYRRDHPRISGRSLIYYYPLLIIVPFIANTSFIGTILANLLPKVIMVITILILLGYTFYKTLRNAIQKLRIELKNSDEKKDKIEDAENIVESEDNEDNEAVIIKSKTRHHAKYIEFDGIDLHLENIKKTDTKNIHPHSKDSLKRNTVFIVILLLITLLTSSFTIARRFFIPCDWEFIVISVSQQVLIIGIGIGICILIYRELHIRENNNYLTTESDIIFSKKNISKIIIISSVTGVMATYIGIGGGTLIAPLMIDLGISPDVMIATGAVSALFTSLVSTIDYVIQMRLMLYNSLIYTISAAIGSFVGIKILSKTTKRSLSFIIFLLCAVILASGIVLLVTIITQSGITVFTEFEITDICE